MMDDLIQMQDVNGDLRWYNTKTRKFVSGYVNSLNQGSTKVTSTVSENPEKIKKKDEKNKKVGSRIKSKIKAATNDDHNQSVLTQGPSDHELEGMYASGLRYTFEDQQRAYNAANLHNNFFLGSMSAPEIRGDLMYNPTIVSLAVRSDALALPRAFQSAALMYGNLLFPFLSKDVLYLGGGLAAGRLFGSQGIPQTVELYKSGDYANASENLFLNLNDGLWLFGAGSKYADGVMRRGSEVVARSVMGAPQETLQLVYPFEPGSSAVTNPVPIAKYNFKEMLGFNGLNKSNFPRLFSIGNYITTGLRFGPKGYYNSLSTNVHPNGSLSYYSGFKLGFDQYQFANFNLDGNDLIDAGLFGKTVDPRFGITKVAQGEGFGPHSAYIDLHYSDRSGSIPVYEVKNGGPSAVNPTGEYYSTTGDLPESLVLGNPAVDAYGHIMETGWDAEQNIAFKHQDLYKFEPTPYVNRHLQGNNSVFYFSDPYLQNRIFNWGMNKFNKLFTPVVIRSKWSPHTNKFSTLEPIDLNNL